MQNRSIAPAIEGGDENGWHKDETWQMDAISSGACGDAAVGTYFEARYWKHASNGEFLVVDEAYFVEAGDNLDAEAANTDETRQRYTATGMYHFIQCTDKGDPGGTEVWSDYAFDYDVDVTWHKDLTEVEAICHDLATADMRWTLTWNPTEVHRQRRPRWN